MMRAVLTLALSLATTTAGAEIQGDALRGEDLFRNCASCHDIGADARNRVGPALNHIFDRPAAAAEGFRYSPALVAAASEGLNWTNATLDAFLENPRAAIKGTRMSFRGLPDPQDRVDLIAYLHQFSDDEPAAASDTAAYAVAPEILALEGDPAFGEYLSGECTSCHQISGGDTGIPSITKWPVESFVTAMHAYKDGARIHPVMQMMAGRLSNEEIAALAAFFKDVD